MSPRRSETKNSSTRELLIDATEQIILEDGFRAVTSRRVGEQANVSSQLVHYYFDSMDELLIATLRKRTALGHAQFVREVVETRSLQAFWAFDGENPILTAEFTSLARHNPAVAAEIKRISQGFRRLQIKAFKDILAHLGVPTDEWPATVPMIALIGISRQLMLDQEWGITAGHKDIARYINGLIISLEAAARPAP